MSTALALAFCCIFLLLALQAAGGTPLQNSDDLGEAQALPETPRQASPALAPEDAPLPPSSSLSVRASVHLKAQLSPAKSSDDTHGNGGELSIQGYPRKNIQGFFDGHGIYNDRSLWGVLDQGGIRLYPDEHLVIALGKERNRRAPGLLISPSDFINPPENLPGTRPQRAGVWLIRASYQSQSQAVDFFILPVDHTNTYGFPTHDPQLWGSALRYSHFFAKADFSLSVGQLAKTKVYGASLQGFVAKVWKLYGESGGSESSSSQSHLLGLGFEGSDTFSLRAELYRNNRGLGLIPGKTLGLLSGSFAESTKLYTLSLTLAQNLETYQHLSFSRIEWLASSHQVVGGNYLYQTKNPQLSMDWSYTF